MSEENKQEKGAGELPVNKEGEAQANAGTSSPKENSSQNPGQGQNQAQAQGKEGPRTDAEKDAIRERRMENIRRGMKNKAKRTRRKFMLIATAVFLLAAFTFLFLKLFIWGHSEETEDAYVGGHMVQINSQIPGRVGVVRVEETDHVKKGDVLVSLDNLDALLAYESAKDGLRMAIRQTRQQRAQTTQADALVKAKETQLAGARDAYARRLRLKGTEAISEEELTSAKNRLMAAEADLESAKAQRAMALAATGENQRIREQPQVMSAINKLKQAYLNLSRTEIVSPVEGQVARRNVQIGQQVGPGSPLMVIVPMEDLWVDANFKETQLRDIRIGQPVTLHADLYGKDVEYQGKIEGISAGSGTAFSLLPSQNATGNWIKVVQRGPVRICLDKEEIRKHPLRVGLSMSVEVNTKDKSGEVMVHSSHHARNLPKAQEQGDLGEIEKVIDGILADQDTSSIEAKWGIPGLGNGLSANGSEDAREGVEAKEADSGEAE